MAKDLQKGDHVEWNTDAQRTDPSSVLAHYRRLIALRHENPVVALGDFAMLLPPFSGVGLKAFDRTGEDITPKLFQPNEFMKVDADYGPTACLQQIDAALGTVARGDRDAAEDTVTQIRARARAAQRSMCSAAGRVGPWLSGSHGR